MSDPIALYFDFVSPYAYLAWCRRQEIAASRPIEAKAVLFAALLDANGQLGPAEIPAKRLYVFKDVVRKAHRYAVPLTPPPAHPFNPLLALRLSSLPMTPEARDLVITRLFKAAWGDGTGISDAKAVTAMLDDLGMNGDEMVAAAGESSAKDAVRAQTTEALQRGAFGVPSFYVDGEMLWGCDAIEDVIRRANGGDPYHADLLKRWKDLPQGAVRKAVRSP